MGPQAAYLRSRYSCWAARLALVAHLPGGRGDGLPSPERQADGRPDQAAGHHLAGVRPLRPRRLARDLTHTPPLGFSQREAAPRSLRVRRLAATDNARALPEPDTHRRGDTTDRPAGAPAPLPVSAHRRGIRRRSRHRVLCAELGHSECSLPRRPRNRPWRRWAATAFAVGHGGGDRAERRLERTRAQDGARCGVYPHLLSHHAEHRPAQSSD